MLDIKRILRGILWRTGLGTRIARLFWRKVEAGPDLKYLYKKSKDVFHRLPADFSDKGFSEFIAEDSRQWSLQEEFVLEITNVLVEPERCIGIIGFNRLVTQTIILPSQYPYIFPYLIKRFFPIKISEALIYDGYASSNNYHHFVNAVNSIHTLEKVDLPAGIPFIISEKSFNSKYFQYLYNRNEQFRSFNWLVQKPTDWLRVNKAYKLQCIHFDAAPWRKTKDLYNLEPKKSYKKVFLSRDSSLYNRCLSNEKEIYALLAGYDFEIVYAEHLTIEEQIEVFQETAYLIALHGAGLVNQVFMNANQAHIIEILPRDYLIGLYYWQAFALGASYYDVVVGSNLDANKNYYLEADKLEEAVVKMLEHKTPGRKYGNLYTDQHSADPMIP